MILAMRQAIPPAQLAPEAHFCPNGASWRGDKAIRLAKANPAPSRPYARIGIAEMSPCPFCPPALNAKQITLESEHCLFLQMPQPILAGSGLIIPKQHRETAFDLTDAEWQDTFALLRRVKALLDASYTPDGYTVGWNCGAVGGQEIFHAHLHIIPRYADEPLAGKGIRYWLKQDDNKREFVTNGAIM